GRAQGRQDELAAGALSARLLRQGIRRPHRRPECRLEGPRLVDLKRRSHALADRRRQGHETHGRALPASTGSAREVNAAALRTWQGRGPRPPPPRVPPRAPGPPVSALLRKKNTGSIPRPPVSARTH